MKNLLLGWVEVSPKVEAMSKGPLVAIAQLLPTVYFTVVCTDKWRTVVQTQFLRSSYPEVDCIGVNDKLLLHLQQAMRPKTQTEVTHCIESYYSCYLQELILLCFVLYTIICTVNHSQQKLCVSFT